MPSNLAQVTRRLANELQQAFTTGEEPPHLEDALCSYVTYFRERNIPAKQIVDTACVLIDRAKGDHMTTGAKPTPQQAERIASDVIDRCLANCMRIGD